MGGAVAGRDAIMVRTGESHDSQAIAELMVECFPREFGLLFGSRLEEAIAVVASIIGIEGVGGAQAFVAQDSTSVIGMLLLESARQARTTLGRAAMWNIALDKVGLWHLPRLLLGVALLSHRVKPGEAYISAVGVTSSARRRGVGGRLLRAAGAWARANHMIHLALHVRSDNAGARSLYQRLGFIERREETHLLAYLLLGQRSIIYMSKALEDTP